MSVFILREFNFNFTLPDFRLDVTTAETRTLDFTVTGHPVETGAIASDFVFSNPEDLSVEGRITATPIEDDAALPLDPLFRLQQLEDDLIALAREKQPVTYVSPLRVVSSLAISSVRFAHDQDAGESLGVTIGFEEIERFDSLSVEVPAALLAASVKPDAQKADAGGAAATSTAGAETAAATDRTIFATLSDGDNPFPALNPQQFGIQ